MATYKIRLGGRTRYYDYEPSKPALQKRQISQRTQTAAEPTPRRLFRRRGRTRNIFARGRNLAPARTFTPILKQTFG